MTSLHVQRDAPGDASSGGNVVVPFADDAEMQSILDAVSARQSFFDQFEQACDYVEARWSAVSSKAQRNAAASVLHDIRQRVREARPAPSNEEAGS